MLAIGRALRFSPARVSSFLRLRHLSSGAGTGSGDDPWAREWNIPKSAPPPPEVSGTSGEVGGSDFDWGNVPSWSDGSIKDHFNGTPSTGGGDGGEPAARRLQELRATDDAEAFLREVEKDNKEMKAIVDSWNERLWETVDLLKQVREPGLRGSYLKDSEKAEMYRLHKADPVTYNVERLAKDYRVMRQRVHAILWLKEMEEEEEKQLGKPLDDSIEILLDNFPEFFESSCREFHVSSLPYKADFKIMPEGWDGKARDPDEVLYEISMKEDQMLYEDFVRRLEFNKKKVAGEVKCHPYSRRRPDDGWKITVEKLGSKGKRGFGGGWKFVSQPDGSSRPLNELEKMFLKRETPRRRRRFLPPYKGYSLISH